MKILNTTQKTIAYPTKKEQGLEKPRKPRKPFKNKQNEGKY